VIRLAVRVSRAQADDALHELLRFSPGGVEEVDDGGEIIEYVLYGASGELPSLPALRAAVAGALVEVATSEIEDDWSKRWRSFHHPVEIAGVLRVRAPWHDPAPPGGPLDLVIEPAQAFGTGAHATTRACLELLVELAGAGLAQGALLDLGTGSGVLAIAAAALGFAPVAAVDNDPESVAAAAQNAAANGVRVDVRALDVSRDPLPYAPTIAANLLRPLLLELAARLPAPPHLQIASGLHTEQADEVAGAFAARHAMRERARRTIGDWTALLLEHSAAKPPASAPPRPYAVLQ
jgi:ribosomal protein L11 methyltransferase